MDQRNTNLATAREIWPNITPTSVALVLRGFMRL